MIDDPIIVEFVEEKDRMRFRALTDPKSPIQWGLDSSSKSRPKACAAFQKYLDSIGSTEKFRMVRRFAFSAAVRDVERAV